MRRYRNEKEERENSCDEDHKDPKTSVETVNNKVFFYDDVTPATVLTLNKTLMDLDAQHLQTSLLESEKPKNIWLYVYSDGGDLFGGFSVMDQLGLLSSPTVTVVDGIAASAATLITVAGTRRLIKKNSFMMIHQLQSGFWGKYEELLDEKKSVDKMMIALRGVYLERTNLKKEKLDEILKHDLHFSAKECLKLGLVDEVL